MDPENGESSFQGDCTSCHVGDNDRVASERKLQQEALEKVVSSGSNVDAFQGKVAKNGESVVAIEHQETNDNAVVMFVGSAEQLVRIASGIGAGAAWQRQQRAQERPQHQPRQHLGESLQEDGGTEIEVQARPAEVAQDMSAPGDQEGKIFWSEVADGDVEPQLREVGSFLACMGAGKGANSTADACLTGTWEKLPDDTLLRMVADRDAEIQLTEEEHTTAPGDKEDDVLLSMDADGNEELRLEEVDGDECGVQRELRQLHHFAEAGDFRLHSSESGYDQISLKEYVDFMPAGQHDIYYITGDCIESLASSSAVQAYRGKGFEVLFAVDPVDEYFLQQLQEFDGFQFRAV